MNIHFFPFICFCLALFLTFPSFIIAENTCGKVFDGVTDGQYDLEYQFSQTTIGANWVNFGNDVLSYDWAIFSKLPPQGNCVKQLRTSPDIQSWKNVKKDTTAINSKLSLQIDQTYFIAVRATFRSGEQVITFSNGVKIVQRDENVTTKTDITTDSKEVRFITTEPSTCYIDENNRCTAAQISVSEKLSELYGKPRFLFGDTNESFIIKTDDDDDDDDDLNDASHVWIFAPIVIGILIILLCCILLLILLALLLAGGKFSLPEMSERAPREKKPPPAAGLDFENPEESKDYALRENAEAGNVGTATVVEFPDTNIRRLSISHRDEESAAAEEPSRRSRIPHPVMSSASSSFRDYRASVNH